MISNLTRRIPALLAAARAVRRETGKSVFSQVREMDRLRRGPGRLRAGDYFAYHVYDDARYPGRTKDDVVSWRFLELSRLNHPLWSGIADDKLVTYAVLSSFGLPVPRVFAVYDPRGRLYGSVPTLTDATGAEAFVRSLREPAFGKPVAGSFGQGASSIDGYDAASDELVMAHGQRLGVAAYVERYVRPASYGYIFQQRVVPHPRLLPITGPSVSTLRMVVLNGEMEARLFRVMWKLAIGDQITDNYRGGSTGNLKAWVDLRDGRVQAAFLGGGVQQGRRKVGPDSLGRFVDRHPDTGTELVGITLPGWDEAVDLVLRAARHFPGLRYQSWDVVLSDSGPTILELNARGLPQQLPGFPGMNDDVLRRFIQDQTPNVMLERKHFDRPYRGLDVVRLVGAAQTSENGGPRG
jgi:hypothetical protein